MQSIRTSSHTVTITGGNDRFQVHLSASSPEPGIDLVHIRLEAEEAERPPVFKLSWIHPVVDIHGYWQPSANTWDKSLRVDWERGFRSKATSSAPVGCFFSQSGQNRLGIAFSDALNPVTIKAGVHEESAELYCAVALFEEPSPPMKRYEATLRLDTRDFPYYETLEQIQRWWASLPGFEPAPVPETARLPMYSTWYSFHQQLTPSGVEEQCKLAKALGCDAVIVDDGWQTSNNERGYAYTGDWQVSPDKIPDMKAHVAKVHELSMKYILWYSVPFIGKHSQAWERFAGKLLGYWEEQGAGILDPRFPEVREYLIETYEKAMKDWDLDGFKLDFVDMFNLTEQSKDQFGGGRDYDSVPEAVDRLLSDVIARLRRIKPDVMVEFRQSYIGPLMRKYGNMFRVGDCPNDALQNRVGSMDIRLLCGDTAAHSDMMMWHPGEPVESAALQIVNSLFAVPQISVLLDKLPVEHMEMVKFWLAFWRENRDVLLDGKLMPRHPELLYPLVIATTSSKRIAAVYNDVVVNPGSGVPAWLTLVNGTLGKRVVLELDDDLGVRSLEVRDCRGRLVKADKVRLEPGLHLIEVPPAGLAVLRERES